MASLADALEYQQKRQQMLNSLNGITRNFVVFPGEEHNLKILDRK